MSSFNLTNLKKTIRYCKKNGIRKAFFTAKERLESTSQEEEVYQSPTESILQKQRNTVFERAIKYSIVVPCYETNADYLNKMIQSVLEQTYSNWELILKDASSSDNVSKIVSGYRDLRILYSRLSMNNGISSNTNEALNQVVGDYVVLLDHDDILTPDALFEVTKLIQSAEEMPVFLYSDEDKTDETESRYFSSNIKPDFNFDLLLTNNYICHLLVVKTEYIRKLRFRKEYDGAQDYDLILRLTRCVLDEFGFTSMKRVICHIPKILYHWRCHSESTAINPQSKMYAYEAGLQAVKDFIKSRNWSASAEHADHLGFYRITEDYRNLWRERPEIGAIGGPIFAHGKIKGGAMSDTGRIFFNGVSRHYSGYMNRAVCVQDVEALDIREMLLRRELAEEFIQDPRVTNMNALQDMHEVRFDQVVIEASEIEGIVRLRILKSAKIKAISLQLSEFLRQKDYLLLYDPCFSSKCGGRDNG